MNLSAINDSHTLMAQGHEEGFTIDGSEIDWAEINDAKITVYPLNQDDKRTSYLGCFTTQVGEKYTVDNEAVIDIQMTALKEVKE